MKLSEFIPRYLEWSRGVHEASTTAANSLALRKLADCVGYETELNDIQIIDAERFVSTLRSAKLKNASVNNHLRHLKTAFSRAEKWEQIKSSPFAKTKLLPLDKKRPSHIRRKAMSSFLSGIERFELRMLITAFLVTGRKRNELLFLKWSDIDTENKTYQVTNTKSGAREYNINGAFRIVLSLLRSNSSKQFSLIKSNKKSDSLIFPYWANPDSVTHLVKQQLIKSGYADLNLNSFHYSFSDVYPPNGGDYKISPFDRSLFEGIPLSDFILREDDFAEGSESGLDEFNVSSKALKTKKIVFTPEVFNIPSGLPQQNLVAVMMPFKNSFQPVYKLIKEVVGSNDLICKRADDIWNSSEIIQDIFELIYKSNIVVCDLTGKNPNVFYETGIAHTLGKHVIPISQSSEGMPFDLFHHRHIFYHNNNEGREDLRKKLNKRISYLLKNG